MKTIDAKTFLNLVWPQQLLRYETLELRAIKRKDNQIKRSFHESTHKFLDAAYSFGKGWDIYFGVSTRFQEGGKKSDCYRARCVWIDLDSKELPDFGDTPPDIIVNSGKGHHIYWSLVDPLFLRTGRWQEIEATNRALTKKFNGDIGALDVSRILRVPGFYNYKYDPPVLVEAYAIQDR